MCRCLDAMGDSLMCGIYCEPTILLLYKTLLELSGHWELQGLQYDPQEGVPPPSGLTRFTTWSQKSMHHT